MSSSASSAVTTAAVAAAGPVSQSGAGAMPMGALAPSAAVAVKLTTKVTAAVGPAIKQKKEVIKVDLHDLANFKVALRTNVLTYGTTADKILKLPLVTEKNKSRASLRIDHLHKLWSNFGFLDFEHPDTFVPLLRERKGCCKFCRGNHYAEMALIADTLEKHENSSNHKKNVLKAARSGKVQGGLNEGMEALRTEANRADKRHFIRAALVAHLTTCGVPHSQAERVLTAEFINAVRSLADVPCARTMRDTLLPSAVDTVSGLIKTAIKGKIMSVHVDGGKTLQVDGKTLIAVMLSSPGLPVDVYLGCELMGHAERATDIVATVEKMFHQFGVVPGQVKWFCADHWTGNKSAAGKLGIPFAGCSPHALAIALNAFMGDFMDIETFFCKARGLLTAGGSVLRLNDAVQWGISASAIDTVVTRWTSLLSAITYLAGRVREFDRKRAATALEHLAEHGDGGAAEPDEEAAAALAEDAAPPEVWAVLYDFFEHLDAELREGNQAQIDFVLGWLANPINYGRTVALSVFFQHYDSLYAMMQGSGAYDRSGEVGSKLTAEISRMELLRTDPSVVIDDVLPRVESRLANAAAQLRAEGAEAGAVELETRTAAHVAAVKKDLMDALPAAAARFLAKKEHVVAAANRLRRRSVLDTNVKPVMPAHGHAAWQHLMMPTSTSASMKLSIQAQYAEYCDGWPGGSGVPVGTVDAAGIVLGATPSAQYAYWEGLLRVKKWPELARYALEMLAAPVGNGRLEAGFSYVTKMGEKDRLTLGAKSFRNELFLKANQYFTSAMMTVASDFVPVVSLEAVGPLAGVGTKRARADRADFAASSMPLAGAGGPAAAAEEGEAEWDSSDEK